MKIIKVSDIEDIVEIVDYVHDRWFDLPDILFDKNNGILSIPLTVRDMKVLDLRRRFLFIYTWYSQIVEAKLIIRNVVNYELKDEAQIGQAEINVITKEGQNIVIDCSPFAMIEAKVSDVDVELILSDNVVEKKSVSSLLGSPKDYSQN